MNEQERLNSGTNYSFRIDHNSLTSVAEAERIRLLSLLSSIQWKQQHRRILDMKHPDTGTWILTEQIFERWKHTIGTYEQQPLWCFGIRKNL